MTGAHIEHKVHCFQSIKLFDPAIAFFRCTEQIMMICLAQLKEALLGSKRLVVLKTMNHDHVLYTLTKPPLRYIDLIPAWPESEIM